MASILKKIILFGIFLYHIQQVYSQCPVHINPIEVLTSSAGSATAIKVSGYTDTKCDSVIVTLSCFQGQIAKEEIATASDHSWSVTFNSIAKNACPCFDKIHIDVICIYQRAIRCSTKDVQTLTCNSCVRIDSIIIDPIKCENRRTNGTWPVGFKIYTSGGTPSSVQMTFGDEASGGGPTSLPIPGTYVTPLLKTHDYNCPRTNPSYTGTVIVSGSSGCVPSIMTFNVDFPECPCPVVEIDVLNDTKCDAKLKASVSGCTGSATEFVWTFTRAGNTTSATTTSPEISPNFPTSGTYQVTVVAIGVGSNCNAHKEITISDCKPGHNGNHPGHNGNHNNRDCGFLGLGCADGFCGGLLVTAIVMLILGGILIILGTCLAINWVSIVGGILGALGLILFGLWVVICARFTSCETMQTVHCTLFWIVAVLGPIVAIIAALFGGLGCRLAAAAVWAGWGTLFAWLGSVMTHVDCTKICG